MGVHAGNYAPTVISKGLSQDLNPDIPREPVHVVQMVIFPYPFRCPLGGIRLVVTRATKDK
jgi:hypothetical protein